ncbi:DsbA family protein [Pseudidiomarina sp.]|uniref:DsbA family protein n=1 Tax=Pseudidiomarina sp. TaxID=2081707 RepID=UPI00299DDF5A|nr:thioredoxin domain-containing protein [Pseudidiomarina sp.]MDX1706625.1 thioredoxin domain-containing protein [Pseudidiomarina sp.]
MNKRILVLSVSVLLIAAFAVAAYFQLGSTSPEPQAAQPMPEQNILVRDHSPTFGPDDAPVTIVEFFDPSCEACRAFYPFVKQILAEHEGDVRLVIRYALFHRGSEEVARMLEAAREQDLYQPVLEAVLITQPDWHDDPAVLAAWEAAASTGLDIEQARKDMYSPEIDAVLQTDMADIKTLNVRGTPTFFVNGKPLPSFGSDQLLQLVRSELARAK